MSRARIGKRIAATRHRLSHPEKHGRSEWTAEETADMEARLAELEDRRAELKSSTKTEFADGEYDGTPDNLYEVRLNGVVLAVEARAKAALSHLPEHPHGYEIIQVMDNGLRCEVPRWPAYTRYDVKDRTETEREEKAA